MKLENLTMVETEAPNGVQAIIKFGPHYELSIVKSSKAEHGEA